MEEMMFNDEITRRDLLQGATGVALGAGALGLLGGAVPPLESPNPAPKRGGVLQISVTDSSTTDSLDPAKPINTHDILALGMIFDALTRLDLNFKVSPGLAESWEPNKNG